MNNEDVSRRFIAVTMKAGKLTARGLAYVLQAAGQKIRKAHRERQAPYGRRQSVKQLMAYGTATSSIEGDAPQLFDRAGDADRGRAGQLQRIVKEHMNQTD